MIAAAFWLLALGTAVALGYDADLLPRDPEARGLLLLLLIAVLLLRDGDRRRPGTHATGYTDDPE